MDISIPPDSIAVNTEEIIKACELAEISGSSSSSSQSFILVTELASLVYLRQYNDARHLWRRYKTDCSFNYGNSGSDNDNANVMNPASSTAIPTKSTGNGTAANDTKMEDLRQFHLLWNTIEPIIKCFYGHRSFLDSNCVESVFTSLQSCVDANCYPLSTYALELKSAIRDQMAELIEMVYDCIEMTKCNILLGMSNNGAGGEELEKYLTQKRGWERTNSTNDGNADSWIPANPPSSVQERNQLNSNGLDQKNKIEFLSGIVAFLEKQRVQI